MHFSESLHHVAIICSNYEVSKKFYTEVLGFTVLSETLRESRQSYKLNLRINDTLELELFSFPNPPKRPSYPEACGLRHIAFHVGSVEEVKSYLESNRIPVEDIKVDEATGKMFTFFNDPDGLPIELYES